MLFLVRNLNLTLLKLNLLFIVVLLFPIIICFIISCLEFNFSFIGTQWQQLNKREVFFCLTFALFSFTFASILIYTSLIRFNIIKLIDKFDFDMDISKRIFLFIMMLVSGYGLYYSFDGNIYDKIYSGPVKAWHGYGAWSVTYTLSFLILFFQYANKFNLI